MDEELAQHFAFGDNWRDYARSVTMREIDEAWRGVDALLSAMPISGLRVLDLGCGSGVHSVAMAQHGAAITAIDIDPTSVSTTRALAERFGLAAQVDAQTATVFDLPAGLGQFDLVYSWGVLHHTGDMWRAISVAAGLVADQPNALLIIALYRRTKLDAFWRLEKRWYKSSPKWMQWLVRRLFSFAILAARLGREGSRRTRRAEYFRARGMSRQHDHHDWLGGYPYESTMPSEVHEFLEARGFFLLREILVLPPNVTGRGIFGSGCDQYVFRRRA